MTTPQEMIEQARVDQINREELRRQNAVAKADADARAACLDVLGVDPESITHEAVIVGSYSQAHPSKERVITALGHRFTYQGGEKYQDGVHWSLALLVRCKLCGAEHEASGVWPDRKAEGDARYMAAYARIGEQLADEKRLGHECREAEIRSIASAIRRAKSILPNESERELVEAALAQAWRQ